jgi:hypothetical protein
VRFVERNVGIIALVLVLALFLYLWSRSFEGACDQIDVGCEDIKNNNILAYRTYLWAKIVLNGAKNNVSDDDWKLRAPDTFNFKDLTAKQWNNMKETEMATFLEQLNNLSGLSNNGTPQTMDGYLTTNERVINNVDISDLYDSQGGIFSDKLEDIVAKQVKINGYVTPWAHDDKVMDLSDNEGGKTSDNEGGITSDNEGGITSDN